MGREENKRIATETLHIMEKGYYFIRRRLKLSEEEFTKVELYSPEKIARIKKTMSLNMKQKVPWTNRCSIVVKNMDSYEAAKELSSLGEKPLVLNFANPVHVGGGFTNGAYAQEESLCRCSTLYASINSEQAKKYYEYNSQIDYDQDSDYMLLSPNVEVFRQATGKVEENSYLVSVMTVAAPNLNGVAAVYSQTEVDEIMERRIRNICLISAVEGYKNLVLGAWGCGAFGHDPEMVASYFKKILIEEEYYLYFDSVVFAVLDYSEQQENYYAFKKEFEGYQHIVDLHSQSKI